MSCACEHPDRVTPHDPIVRVDPFVRHYLEVHDVSGVAKILEEHARMITALEAIAAGGDRSTQAYAQSVLDGCDP